LLTSTVHVHHHVKPDPGIADLDRGHVNHHVDPDTGVADLDPGHVETPNIGTRKRPNPTEIEDAYIQPKGQLLE
jgi:hypothetical protein